MNMNSLNFLLTTLLVLIYSKNFAQTNYYKMKNGKILTEEQSSTVKQNASKNGKVEEIILKREIKNDSIINTTRITILMRDDKNNYFDPYSEPKKLIGKHFPIENFKNSKQKQFSKNYLKGKPTFINFWFTRCLPCIEEIPMMNNLKEKYGDKVNFIAITYENKKSVDDFLKKKNINFQHITNSKKEIDNLKYSSYPTNLILDKNGNLKYVYGEISDFQDDIELILDNLLEI